MRAARRDRLPRYRPFCSRNSRGDRGLPGEVLLDGRAALAQAYARPKSDWPFAPGNQPGQF